MALSFTRCYFCCLQVCEWGNLQTKKQQQQQQQHFIHISITGFVKLIE